MVGNKHKNGIICTFPGCQKPMRTQKFKLHFTKAHLKQGEVYSVEHRRRFEVAREEGASRQASGGGAAAATAHGAPSAVPGQVEAARLGVKTEAAAPAAAPPAVAGVEASAPRLEPVAAPVNITSLAVSALKPHEEAQASQPQPQLQHQPVPQPQSHAPAVASAGVDVGAALKQQLPLAEQRVGVTAVTSLASIPTSASTEDSSAQHGDNDMSVGSKRPASSMESAAGADGLDPSSALLVEFVSLMDRRFQELVGKMGEMIDVQKQLIDALHGRHPTMFSSSSSSAEQASGMALAASVESVMKKRKQDADLRDASASAGVGHGHGHEDHTPHTPGPDESGSYML